MTRRGGSCRDKQEAETSGFFFRRGRQRPQGAGGEGSRFEGMAGGEEVKSISRPFKLPSREFHPEDTVIHVGDVRIGDGSLTVMAGPCSVESREGALETAQAGDAAGGGVAPG